MAVKWLSKAPTFLGSSCICLWNQQVGDADVSVLGYFFLTLRGHAKLCPQSRAQETSVGTVGGSDCPRSLVFVQSKTGGQLEIRKRAPPPPTTHRRGHDLLQHIPVSSSDDTRYRTLHLTHIIHFTLPKEFIFRDSCILGLCDAAACLLPLFSCFLPFKNVVCRMYSGMVFIHERE